MPIDRETAHMCYVPYINIWINEAVSPKTTKISIIKYILAAIIPNLLRRGGLNKNASVKVNTIKPVKTNHANILDSNIFPFTMLKITETRPNPKNNSAVTLMILSLFIFIYT